MYIPGIAPRGQPTIDDLLRFVEDELKALSQAMNNLDFLVLNVRHVEPDRLLEGMVAVADGTDWDPGSGEGAYIYRSGAWHFLG